jgi:transcriptional regulator with PAS, ATPase and Fis domain
VVEIEVGPCDLLEGLKRAKIPGGPLGFIGFPNIVSSAGRLADLLEIDLKVVYIENESQVLEKLIALKKAGVNTVLGDRIVTSLAKAHGLIPVLIQSGPEAVASALKEAQERLALLAWAEDNNRSRLEALSQFKTVLEALEDPVLILDAQGKTRIQNPAAARLWGDAAQGKDKNHNWTYLSAFQKVINSGLPQLDNLTVLGGQRFLLEFRPIATHHEASKGSAALVAVIGRSAEKVEKSERRLRRAVYLKGHVARFRFSDIITQEPSFQKVLIKAAEYASTGSAILIQGESGTGKEMLAQSVHNHKFDHISPFVAINCASLPVSILESELFGYAPGAFTGALKEGKKGFFELAHGGTLFLDELGEMPLGLQNRLLRVIEEKAVLPLGADRLVPVEVRIIASTNSDLAESVRKGLFRKDLYFRLAVLLLTLPPMRSRGCDPLVLFKHLAAHLNPDLDLRLFDRHQIADQILGHLWPGNAREIKNLVQRLSITTQYFTENLKDLPELIALELSASKLMASSDIELNVDKPPEGPQIMTKNKSDLAKLMGISRTTLWRRLKKQSEISSE